MKCVSCGEDGVRLIKMSKMYYMSCPHCPAHSPFFREAIKAYQYWQKLLKEKEDEGRSD